MRRLRFLREEIRRLDEKAEVLRARAERLTPILTGMPSGSHDHDQMAGIIAELVDNERRTAEKALALTQACEDAERWLDALPEQQRRVMRLYYVDGKRWRSGCRIAIAIQKGLKPLHIKNLIMSPNEPFLHAKMVA